jgi:hypothetical protein
MIELQVIIEVVEGLEKFRRRWRIGVTLVCTIILSRGSLGSSAPSCISEVP